MSRLWTVLAALGLSFAMLGADPSADEPAANNSPPPPDGLRAALLANADHLDRWIEAGDARGVTRVIGGMNLLIDLLAARGDDAAWQQTTRGVREALQAVDAKTRAGVRTEAQREACFELTDLFRAQVNALRSKTPAGNPAPLPRRAPVGGIRNLMYLLDSTLADAKQSAEGKDFTTAKLHVEALTDLGRLMQGFRPGDDWSKLSLELIDFTRSTAASTTNDQNAFRQMLHEVRVRCDTCHEKQ